MFHLFTLQGKRIDAKLEHLPKNLRVHHAKSNSRLRKFNPDSAKAEGHAGQGFNAFETYREMSDFQQQKSPVFHASEIMSSPVLTIRWDVSVIDAWNIFNEKKVHHMPVVADEERLAGIVSDRDLLRKIIINDGKAETQSDTLVRDVMSEEVIATNPLTDIRRIARGMLDHHIGAMPVVNEEGAIVGIITRSDILFAIIHNPGLNLWA